MAYEGSPLVSGYQYQPYSPTEGMPGGLGVQLAGAMALPLLEQQTNSLSLGLQGNRNPYNTLQRQLFDSAHRTGMQQAALRDQQFLMEAARGAAALYGVAWGKEQQQATQNIIDAYNSFPIEARAMLADVATGGRSAISMYQTLHLGGRYGMDPVTGFRGMSANTSATVAGQLTDYYYGTDESMRTRALGLSSRQMGGLYDALQRRGLGPDPGDLRSRVAGALNAMDEESQVRVLRRAHIDPERLRRTPHGAQLSGDEVSRLAGLEEVQQGMGVQHAGRIIRQLDRYKGAVKAMQEIFGDAGHPDAPVEQIFQALENLTGNTLQQMDSGRMEMLVRNMQNLSRSAGISLEGMMGIVSDAGRLLDERGVNRAFQLPTALNTVNMAVALQDTGALSRPVWGLGNQEQLLALEQRRYAGAVASPAMNRFGMAMRLEERLGGFAEDSEAYQLVQQIRSGNVSAEFATMNDQRFVEMMARSTGMSAPELEQQLRFTTLNEPFGFEHGAGGVTRRAQAAEMDRYVIGRAFEAQLGSSMYARTGKTDRKVAAAVADVATRTLRTMDSSIRNDVDRRYGAMSREIRAELERTESGREYLGKLGDTYEEQDKQLRLLAEGMYGRAERDWRRVSGQPTGYLVNEFTLDSPEVQQRAGVSRERSQLESLIQRSMSGYADASTISRLMRGLREAGVKPDRASLLDVFSRGMGNVPKEEIERAIVNPLLDLYSQGSAIFEERERLGRKMDQGTATDAERSRYHQLSQKAAAVGEQINRLKKIHEEKNLGEATQERATAGKAEAAAPAGDIVIQGASIYLQGEEVLRNAETTIRTGGPGRQSTPNAGMN